MIMMTKSRTGMPPGGQGVSLMLGIVSLVSHCVRGLVFTILWFVGKGLVLGVLGARGGVNDSIGALYLNDQLGGSGMQTSILYLLQRAYLLWNS